MSILRKKCIKIGRNFGIWHLLAPFNYAYLRKCKRWRKAVDILPKAVTPNQCRLYPWASRAVARGPHERRGYIANLCMLCI